MAKIHYAIVRCVDWQRKDTDSIDLDKVTCKRCLRGRQRQWRDDMNSIDERIIREILFSHLNSSKFYINDLIRQMRRKQYGHTSQSAKPRQAHIPTSPCPADTLNTPPNRRHPRAKDCEVNEDTRTVKKLCDCQFHLHPCQTIGKSAIPNPDCEKCHGTGWIDLDEIRKHKLSEELE